MGGLVSRSPVTVTGETREYKTRHFCPICGSPLFDRFGEEFELHQALRARPQLIGED